jgi:hypothetical protein
MRFGFDGIKNDKYLALKGKMQNKTWWGIKKNCCIMQQLNLEGLMQH